MNVELWAYTTTWERKIRLKFSTYDNLISQLKEEAKKEGCDRTLAIFNGPISKDMSFYDAMILDILN